MKPLILKVPLGLVRVFPHAIEGYVDFPVTVGEVTVMGSNLIMMNGEQRQVLNTPEQIDAMLGLGADPRTISAIPPITDQ